MEKINKKKVVMIIIIALVVIAIIALGIILLGGNNEDDPFKNAGSISKTESEFEPLTITDIETRYVEERKETILDFSIMNKTNEKVEPQTIKIHLLNEKDELISSLSTDVSAIDANANHPVNITLAGNIQGITKIKLVKPEETTEQ